ncbi:GTP-binding protein Di-Ras1-like [Oratosquilla oratoria]|uniref:GTP-binding protein Di-Ras1-like n=1 Tax=Oratosquilla oratoria TaxID=337810 RepID=UPI003F7701EA
MPSQSEPSPLAGKMWLEDRTMTAEAGSDEVKAGQEKTIRSGSSTKRDKEDAGKREKGEEEEKEARDAEGEEEDGDQETKGTRPRRHRGSLREDKRKWDGEKNVYKVIVMGHARVGKTSLISKFLYDVPTTAYKPTIEELHRVQYEVEGDVLTLDVLDTSGSHPFPAMRELAIRKGHAFLLVYAINDPQSWNTVESLRKEIVEIRGPRVPVVVTGNKLDLASCRFMERVEVQKKVTGEWNHAYLETCSFQAHNVFEVFKEVLAQGKVRYNLTSAVERRRKSLPTPSGKARHEMFFLKRHSCNVS